MSTLFRLSAAALAIGLGSAAVAPAAAQGQPQSDQPQAQQQGDAAIQTPEACRMVVQMGGRGDFMNRMQGRMSQMMQEMMGSDIAEAQRSMRETMFRMSPPMMMGMMAQDVDLAWICAMIPHHQGAIAMARVVIRNGDDEEAKGLAREVIDGSEREVRKLVAWVEKNADRLSRKEKSGATGAPSAGRPQPATPSAPALPPAGTTPQ